MDNKNYDVVIIGAGLSGLVAAYTLSSFGVKCCLLEKNSKIGGGNISFENELGDIFDSGFHALDDMRSVITNKLFRKVINQECIRVKLKRGIYIGGELIDYNSPVEEWPASISSKISISSEDEMSGDVTFEKISKIFGSEFATFCEDEIFNSYPSEVRSVLEGRDRKHKFNLIYPWFFPKVKKSVAISDSYTEWENYHNSMREKDQYVLYPKDNGFYGFIEGMFDHIDKKYCDVFLECGELNINMDDKYQCTGISTKLLNISAENYFWCAPFFGLAAKLKLPMPEGIAQTLVLGSFRFNGDLNSSYHEILVGDKSHKINRISFPGNIRKSKNNLVQVEFFYPTDEINMDVDAWRTCWVESLRRMNIIELEEVESFRFDIQAKGMVTKTPLNEISEKYSGLISNVGSNFFVPFVNAGPENINRLVPEVISRALSYVINEWRGS